MWCAPGVSVGVFIFKAYFFKKFIFAACLPKHFHLVHFRKYNAKAGLPVPPQAG